jgi:hypothetical protein
VNFMSSDEVWAHQANATFGSLGQTDNRCLGTVVSAGRCDFWAQHANLTVDVCGLWAQHANICEVLFRPKRTICHVYDDSSMEPK